MGNPLLGFSIRFAKLVFRLGYFILAGKDSGFRLFLIFFIAFGEEIAGQAVFFANFALPFGTRQGKVPGA